MNILFLDFDGVIRTSRSCLAGLTANGFDPVAGRLITQLAEQTHAKIVISSSWREHKTLSEIIPLLAESSIPHSLMHVDWATPVLLDTRSISRLVTTHELAECAETELAKNGFRRAPREVEVKGWLARHPETARYVTIDDGIGFTDSGNLVLTTIDEGFCISGMISAFRILAHDPRLWLMRRGFRLNPAEESMLRTHFGPRVDER